LVALEINYKKNNTYMLISRVLTALVLLPLAIYGILFLSNDSFAIVFGLILLLGAYEWAGFAKFSSKLAKITLVLVVAIALYSLWLMNSALSPQVMSAVVAVFWLFNLILVFAYPRSAAVWKDKPLIIALMGIILLSLTWYALVAIHAIAILKFAQTSISGPYLVLAVMILVWLADTGAYFSGRRFGKIKLAPEVSPGKSREGVFGGLLLAVIIAMLFAFWHKAGLQDYQKIILITVVTVLFSVIGDLMESMFKRQAGIKDSGNILPGHGGILDRIDSITAAGPIFYIAISMVYQ